MLKFERFTIEKSVQTVHKPFKISPYHFSIIHFMDISINPFMETNHFCITITGDFEQIVYYKETGLTGFKGSYQIISPETKVKGVRQGFLGFIFKRIPILFHG